MTDRASASLQPVAHVQLVEEIDPDAWERVLGSFAIVLEDDGDEPYVEPGITEEEAQALDGLWYGDPESEEPHELAAEIEASEAAWERAASIAETRIQADPHRRLPIDEALSLARTLGERVTVWLDHEPWDATQPPAPDAERIWPPAALDLRPRWHYEVASGPRATAWTVDFSLTGPGITGAIALEAVRREPNVLEAELIPDGYDADTETVEVRVLLAHSDEAPATEAHDILEALGELLGNPPGSVGVGTTWPEPADGIAVAPGDG